MVLDPLKSFVVAVTITVSVGPMVTSTHKAVVDTRNDDVEVYINGQFFHRSRAKISVFDSGYLVGDGIWEGLRLHDDEFAFLDRHLDRLIAASKTTGIDVGSRTDLVEALRQTVQRNDMHDNVHVRLMVTRGDKSTPSQHPSNLVGGPNVVIIAEHKRADPSICDSGISLYTATVRRPAPDSLDQKLNCHSKLHEVMALLQAVGAGADEALMLDPNGSVATCNATNFFIVRDQQLWTSTGMYNLGGITRAVILECARRSGIVAHERAYSLSDVYAADEAFVTGTFGGITPVREIDGRRIGEPGEALMTDQLRGLYQGAIADDIAAQKVLRK